MSRAGHQWTDEQRRAHSERIREAWTPERRERMSQIMRGNKRHAADPDPVVPTPSAAPELLKRASYGTQAEIEFLDRLGQWHGKFSRRVLLGLYLEAMPKRGDWGGIDRDAVRLHVLRQIELEANP